MSDRWEDRDSHLLVEEAKKKPPDKERTRHSPSITSLGQNRGTEESSLIIERDRPPDKKRVAGQKGKRRGQDEVP